jgi:hypothetical protein
MDPITIALTVIGMASTAWKAAKAAGLLGSPEWAKYVDSGLHIAEKGAEILGKIAEGSSEYDTMTPDQIRTLLAPADWDEIEARAKAELAAEG